MTTLSDYMALPCAAAAAIVPAYRFFVHKTERQLGEKLTPMSYAEGCKRGVKVMPSMACTVGLQLVLQKWVAERLAASDKDKQHVSMMAVNAFIVGVFTAPGLAVFNGSTMGQSAWQAVKNLSLRQVAVLGARETSFLFSLEVSSPVTEKMKQIVGDRPEVEAVSAFASGFFGSLVGHPFDTTFTCWQKGVTVQFGSRLMWGALTKATGVGVFSLAFQTFKKFSI